MQTTQHRQTYSLTVSKTKWGGHFNTPPKRKDDWMDIDNNFTYHAPKEDQIERYKEIRSNAKQFAKLLDSLCPPSRERSLAMTKLEECVMWANASIARNE